MPFIAYPFTFSDTPPATNLIKASEVNGNFSAISGVVNGGLDSSNLAPGGVATANIADGSVTEPKHALGANGPAKGAFMAHRIGALSLATGATVVFDTEAFDISNWYDPATGKYTPQVAGYYRVSWTVTCGTTLVADSYWMAYVDKSGAGYKEGGMTFQRGTFGIRSSGSTIALMNGSTDYLDIAINHNNGGSVAVNNTAISTWFCGELIGRS